MDILSILNLLWRRKWVVLTTSVVAAVLLAVTVVTAPPRYRAASAMVLLSSPRPPDRLVADPTSDEARRVQNPYAGYGDLSIVVDIVRRVMLSQPTAQALYDKGLVGTYDVAANIGFYRGPIIEIATEAPTAEAAVHDTQLVADQLKESLFNMQQEQGTDPNYFIKVDVVVNADRASKVLSSTLRRALAAGAVLFLAVLGSAVLADNIVRRRQGSRRPPRPEGLESPVDDRYRMTRPPSVAA